MHHQLEMVLGSKHLLPWDGLGAANKQLNEGPNWGGHKPGLNVCFWVSFAQAHIQP